MENYNILSLILNLVIAESALLFVIFRQEKAIELAVITLKSLNLPIPNFLQK
jgi:hypothetical protein